MTESNGYTRTEKKIVNLLSDGLPHTREEVHDCLWDEEAPLTAIQMHISRIRAKIRPRGEEIVCELRHRTIHYRHVRLLDDPYKG